VEESKQVKDELKEERDEDEAVDDAKEHNNQNHFEKNDKSITGGKKHPHYA